MGRKPLNNKVVPWSMSFRGDEEINLFSKFVGKCSNLKVPIRTIVYGLMKGFIEGTMVVPIIPKQKKVKRKNPTVKDLIFQQNWLNR